MSNKNECISVKELQHKLGWTYYKFYCARASGALPAPTVGTGVRKAYSKAIAEKLVSKYKV